MKPLTGQEIRWMEELNAELLTAPQIAEFIGCTPETVRRNLAIRGIPRADARTRLRATNDDTLRIRKHIARRLEGAASRHANGSVRQLLVERFAEHPRLVELAMKAPMDEGSP